MVEECVVDTKIMLDNKSNVFVNTLLSKNARLETCTGAYIAVCDRNACCCHVTRAISRKASYLIVEAVHRIAKICNFKSMPNKDDDELLQTQAKGTRHEYT